MTIASHNVGKSVCKEERRREATREAETRIQKKKGKEEISISEGKKGKKRREEGKRGDIHLGPGNLWIDTTRSENRRPDQ